MSYTAGKPLTQKSSLDVFCHVIFDVNIDVMDVRERPQEFVEQGREILKVHFMRVIICLKVRIPVQNLNIYVPECP
jgi:hypothetical protein